MTVKGQYLYRNKGTIDLTDLDEIISTVKSFMSKTSIDNFFSLRLKKSEKFLKEFNDAIVYENEYCLHICIENLRSHFLYKTIASLINSTQMNLWVCIIPCRSLVKIMNVELLTFERLIWDICHHKIADIDIPVLILGIDA